MSRSLTSAAVIFFFCFFGVCSGYISDCREGIDFRRGNELHRQSHKSLSLEDYQLKEIAKSDFHNYKSPMTSTNHSCHTATASISLHIVWTQTKEGRNRTAAGRFINQFGGKRTRLEKQLLFSFGNFGELYLPRIRGLNIYTQERGRCVSCFAREIGRYDEQQAARRLNKTEQRERDLHRC